MMHRLSVLIILFTCFTKILFAQEQSESSLMSYGGGRNGASSCLFRDYQTIGINPANLGIFHGDEVQVTTGAMDASALFYSEALPKSQIVPSLLHHKHLTAEEKISIAKNFLITGNSFTDELMPFGIVLQFPKVGGIGFSWRERMTGDIKFSEPLADLIFNGINSKYVDTIVYDVVGHAIGYLDDSVNAGEFFNGSYLKYNWLREFNISFGRAIIAKKKFNMYLGGGVKFLQSNAIVDIAFDQNNISGFAAFSPLFKIDYANFTDPSVELGGRFSPVGRGLGFDAGTTISFSDKIFAAVSVTDIGSIKYTGNLVTITDAFKDSIINFIGINEAQIFSDFDSIFNAEALFHYLPGGERTVTLPTQIRAGAGWHANKHFDFAVDVLQPLNKVAGNLPQTQFAALVNYIPVKAIKLSGGLVGGGFEDFDVPVGISFSFVPDQIWQISIGTGDIVSWLRQDKPTVSLNVSLLRFHYE